jgi:hypothetical protein
MMRMYQMTSEKWAKHRYWDTVFPAFRLINTKIVTQWNTPRVLVVFKA